MAIENQKLEYGQEVTEEGLTRIKHRNKVIKLADSSDGVLETVIQYQPNPLASDSENEKKLQKAEYRDYQEKIKNEAKNFSRKKFKAAHTETSNPPLLFIYVFPAWSQGACGVGLVGQPQQVQQGSPFVSSTGSREQGADVTPVGALITGGKKVIFSRSWQPHTTT